MTFKVKVTVSNEATVEAKNADEARGVVRGVIESKMPGWKVESVEFLGKVLKRNPGNPRGPT